MKKIILFIFLLSIYNAFATIRYVSHSGTSTPPYLTWETAADSIMSAINISSFGDTIYVANGVYEEQVVMIPGLSLIGAGMDSCVIDTRDYALTTSYRSVLLDNNCLLKGFQILIANNTEVGGGIGGTGSNSVITMNRVTKGKYGIFCGSDPLIYKNLVDHISSGIYTFNSNSVVRKNIISTDPNSQSTIIAAIRIEAFDFTYTPVIDSNLIYAYSEGIDKSYGARPIIKNNVIFLNPADAMYLSHSDSTRVFNNFIYGRGYGIYNYGVYAFSAVNNYIDGEIGKGIALGLNGDMVKNNVVTNADVGIYKPNGSSSVNVQYNNLWKDSIKYSGFTADTTNISVDPMVVNGDSTQGDLDFHLQMFSPLIDRGDPNILDKDSSRSDIGLYGGPFGESYQYLDLPPRTPVNFTAVLDTNDILLSWNKNTEADFNHYNLYRDTTENFTADSTTFAAALTDTFYLHIRPEGIENLYFKLTAVDNQGNESEPSEELHIILTGTRTNEQFTISNYKLFQNYPNPFNPSTKIGYRLKERGYVKLYVYDIKGELVETLVNKYQEGGYYEVNFDASRIQNSESSIKNLASGIYIYQIMVRSEYNIPVFSDIKKMVYIK